MSNLKSGTLSTPSQPSAAITPVIYGPAFSPYVRSARLYAEELGISHLNNMQPRGEPVAFKSAEHLALNPFGKAPVMIHGELVLFETASICRYLDNLAGEASLLAPLSAHQRALADQWAGAVAVYAGPALMNGFFLEFAFPKGENGSVRMEVVVENLPAARAFLAIIEAQLQQQAYLAGDNYSMADSLLTPMLDYAETLPLPSQEAPLVAADSRLAGYIARMRARKSAWVLGQS